MKQFPTTITPEAKRSQREALASVGLDPETKLVIFGKGRVRHIRGQADRPRGRGVTWCNMFYQADKLRDCDDEYQFGDEKLPICGACTRTLTATVTRGAA